MFADPKTTAQAYTELFGVEGCDECNRTDPKPWSIYTVNYHGVEVCAKCLQPMNRPRKPRTVRLEQKWKERRG